MRFDITDLRLFIHVAESGSITAGAQRTNIALSAASSRIAGMEAKIGVPLLLRQRSGVTLTPVGHALLQHARTIVRQFDRMSGELDEFTYGLKGQVRLFTNTNAEAGYLPDALSQFLITHPAVNVDLQEHLSEDIVQALLDGIADIGIMSADTDHSMLQSFGLATDRLVLIVAIGHRLSSASGISFADILDEDFISLSETAAMQSFLTEQASRSGRRMRSRLRLRGFDGICRMVANGAGIAVVPRSSAEMFAQLLDLKIIPLTDTWAERRLRICVRNLSELTPQGRKLVEHLIDAKQGTSHTPRH